MARCDCLNYCGDDPWLKDGRALPCARLAEERRLEQMRSGVVAEHAEFAATGKLVVTYSTPLSDEQQSWVLKSFIGGDRG